MNTLPKTPAKCWLAFVCAISLLSVSLFGQEKTPTHPHVSYGPEDRQWLNLYLPSGSEPAPVFLYAHHNGSTADGVKSDWADRTVAEGTAIVSWESIAQVKGMSDFQICAADAKVMFAWVKENAATYNFDIDKIFIGGQSRGSFVSWELAHSLDASIVGIYMGQALPGSSFNERLLEPITKKAPPIFLAYRKEPGAVGDIHDSAHGLKVLERYKELGIGNNAELVHSLNDTKDNQVMQFLPEFVRSVIDVNANKDAENPLFYTAEILDESTLETKTLQDWHPVGATRQKLVEINVAEWWPGQDYRIPVRLIVPLEGKAKGFSITGANPYETLMEDSQPTDFQAKLLAGGVGIVKTHVKAFREIPGKQGLEQKMMRVFMEDLNPRYTPIWIWSMTLMRATTAAYAEVDHFEKGKVAGSGSSKNGISPAVALINDERFTATCSNIAFAYYSPTRRADREEMAKVTEANKAFFEAVKTGDIDLAQNLAKIYQRVMVGSESGMDKMALKTGRSMDEMQTFADRLWSSVCVTENWGRLMERGVDVLFQPGTHDYVAFDVLWGAQNHPQLPVYYEPSGGHYQTPHVAAAKDEQNRDAFLWHHFFGGDPLLKPPTSSHKVDKDKLSVSVRFNEGPQPISGRIWWIYDRAPAGSAPFLHVQIPEDQWMDMEFDAKTGAWTATIPLKDGFERIDFFSNHGLEVNGYKQYLSSPYTRVELSPSRH